MMRMICLLLGLVLREGFSVCITIKRVSRECMVASRLPLVRRDERSENSAIEVLSFAGKSGEAWYCGLLPKDQEEACVGDTLDLEGVNVASEAKTHFPIALATALADAAQKRSEAIILGSGRSSKLAKIVFEAFDVKTRVVGPEDAADLGVVDKDVLFVDFCGSEPIKNPDYLSLISPKALSLIDNGIFAKPQVTKSNLEVDVRRAAELLSEKPDLLNRLADATKSSSIMRFFVEEDRAADEYLDFLKWGRDADNRGRRLGFERFYDDAKLKRLLEEGNHFDLLDNINQGALQQQ